MIQYKALPSGRFAILCDCFIIHVVDTEGEAIKLTQGA
jgi:hypothetical protein